MTPAKAGVAPERHGFNMDETDYREAYEHEHIKCAELAARVADLEAKNEELCNQYANQVVEIINEKGYSI